MEADLFGLYGPEPSAPAEARHVHRVLGAACGATYFVWAQHQGPTTLLGYAPSTELRERWLRPLARGEVLGGTAFAHLRRRGTPAVVATPAEGGWLLDGEAPWATSWGLAGVYSVAAMTADRSRVVWALIEGREGRGLSASAPLKLAVMQATRTVQLRFDGYAVADTSVLLDIEAEAWSAIDDTIAARLNPAALGVADAALAHLRALVERGLGGEASDVANALSSDLAACAVENEALALAADGGDVDLEALSAGRAWGLDLALRSANALLLAAGGRGIDRSHPAQRLVREAAFYGVQAQTPAGRRASLRRLTPG